MGIVHAKAEPRCPADLKKDPHVVVDEEAICKHRAALNCVKARVDRVNVDGLKRTKDEVVRGTVVELFQARDFEDVIVRAQKVRQALDNLGCFRNVCVYIDVSTGPDATPDGLEVTFQVRELSRLMGGVNASVGEEEGNVVIDFKLPNIWGRGEQAQAVYSLGYRNTCSFNISGSKPLLHHPFEPVISASLYQQNQDYPWSGYHLLDRGLHFNLDFKTSSAMRHNLQWEALLRDLSVINKTSFAVRESCGPQLKSSLRHTISMDTRDAEIFPTEGLWLFVSNELAGIGGGVANFKSETQFQTNHTLSEEFGVVLQAAGAFGILHDVYGTTLSEHFFLGGPTSLRGFQQRGVGPHEDGQAIGGRVYWSSAVHLYSPLPLAWAQQGVFKLMKSHLFLNAGCLAFPGQSLAVRLDRSNFKLSNLSSLTAARVACGAGVCVQIGSAARLEVNYVTTQNTHLLTDRSNFKLSNLSSLTAARVACGAGVCVQIGSAARLEVNYVTTQNTHLLTDRSNFKLSNLSSLTAARVACGAGVCVQIGSAARLEVNYVTTQNTHLLTDRSNFKLSNLSSLTAARVACGAGVCVQIGSAARLEVNYVVPLMTHARDIPISGLQFGVGAHFL